MVYKVDNIQNVNTTHYKEGDVFLTKNTIALLHNGKIEALVKKSDVKKLIKDEVEKQMKQVIQHES